MKVTTLLTAAILAVAPGLAFASCSGYGHSETASASCASGLVWDNASRACIDKASS